MHSSIRSLLLVTLGAVASVPAQDAPASRPDDAPIVDPAICGSWRGNWWGKYSIFTPLLFEIGPIGQFKESDDSGSRAYLLEASAGRWALRSTVPGESASSGTYRLGRNGQLEWRPSGSQKTLHLDRQGPPALASSRPTLTRSELESTETVPKLLRLLSATDPAHRGIASLRLAVVAAEHREVVLEAVPALVEHLDDITPEVRWHCVLALKNVEAHSRVAGTAMLKRVQDSDSAVRGAAIEALRPIVRDPAVVVPILAKALSDSELSIRGIATHELGAMGRRAGSAVPALTAVVNNAKEPRRLREAAKDALDQIEGGQESRPNR